MSDPAQQVDVGAAVAPFVASVALLAISPAVWLLVDRLLRPELEGVMAECTVDPASVGLSSDLPPDALAQLLPPDSVRPDRQLSRSLWAVDLSQSVSMMLLPLVGLALLFPSSVPRSIVIIYVVAAVFFFFLPFLLTAGVKQRSLYGQRLLGPYTRFATLGLIANVGFAVGAWYLATNTG